MDYIQFHELYHSELMHHGIKGMRWGIRNYQNEDGSLTPEGVARYNTGNGSKTVRRIAGDMQNDYRNSKKQMKGEIKSVKREYREGTITKEQREAGIQKAYDERAKRDDETFAKGKELAREYGDSYGAMKTKGVLKMVGGTTTWAAGMALESYGNVSQNAVAKWSGVAISAVGGYLLGSGGVDYANAKTVYNRVRR